MALGKVQVNNLNLMQGPFNAIENLFLFIGDGANPANNNKLLTISGDTDLDALLGVADSDLKTQIQAAKVNAGQNWGCLAVPIDTATEDWRDALDLAMQTASMEAVVVCKPVTTATEINNAYAKTQEILASHSRFIFVMLAIRGCATDETWADYLTAANGVIDGIAANRVMVVPQLHDNNLGVLAGRLSSQALSIADSPMRVASGAVVGLGDWPTDMNDAPLDMSVLQALDADRFSVPQTYNDYPGIYWGDGNLLDVPAGDFQAIENLRVLDYCARRVRILAIARVADRKLNSTPNSIEYNKTYFMRPLREASRTLEFNGIPFPGMIEPPEDGDIEIMWRSKYEVDIYIKAKPFNAPKKITVNLMLDLSSD